MGDLFGEWVPREWIDRVLNVVGTCESHQFLFLTKNPERLIEFNTWPGNAWVGATATNQKQADRAAEALSCVEAEVRFISAEPLLEEIRFKQWPIDWLIIGPCRKGSRTVQPERKWVEFLTGQAREHGSAVFHKNNLMREEVVQEWPL